MTTEFALAPAGAKLRGTRAFWRPILHLETIEAAVVSCPSCGHEFGVVSLSPEGVSVAPVECQGGKLAQLTRKGTPCTWRDTVRLVEFTETTGRAAFARLARMRDAEISGTALIADAEAQARVLVANAEAQARALREAAL